MKKEMLEELIRKYENKLEYREQRLANEKDSLKAAATRYGNNKISYEAFEKAALHEAIQQDLYNMLYEIVEDLKEAR